MLQGLQLQSSARDALITPAGLAAIKQQALIQHHGLMVSTIGEHPAAAEACRLAKRWVACQLLSWHIPCEMTELLVAAAFTACVGIESCFLIHLIT